MLRGLTTSASGMAVDERLQQLVANNLANAETPGFKPTTGAALSFPEQLIRMVGYTTENFNTGTSVGKMGTGVVFQEGVPNFAEGSVQSTGRNLDVAVVDSSQPGTLAAVLGANNQSQVADGTITAGGPGGRLQIAGQPLAVLDAQGQPVAGVYAIKNPAYTGQALTAADGKPNYDANGQPSYLYATTAGKVVGSPANAANSGWGLRVGTSQSMGQHSFYAVAYHSLQGINGIALTRDGHFQVNAQNQLVDSAGNPILPVGLNGKPIAQGRIVLNTAYQGKNLFNADGTPAIDQNGQPSYKVVDTNGNPIRGRLGLVDVNVSNLKPLGATEFQVGNSLATNTVLPLLSQGSGKMEPGSLEQSGVDLTQSMTTMMDILNQYDANQRMIQMQDTELGKAVNDVGKTNL